MNEAVIKNIMPETKLFKLYKLICLFIVTKRNYNF